MIVSKVYGHVTQENIYEVESCFDYIAKKLISVADSTNCIQIQNILFDMKKLLVRTNELQSSSIFTHINMIPGTNFLNCGILIGKGSYGRLTLLKS